jgi:Ca2+-dependent lipid-binding protein
MDIPMLQEFINNLINMSLAWYVHPSTFSMDIEEMMKADKMAQGMIIAVLWYSFDRNSKDYDKAGKGFAECRGIWNSDE